MCTPSVFTSTVVGDLVSWSVDTGGHIFPAHGGAADEPYPHVVVDRAGVPGLAAQLGYSVRQVERHLDAYAVVAADNAIVTVGHRTTRRPWP